MYAVIKSGGKQYKVEKGDKLKVEKLATEEGKNVVIDQVLMIADGDDVTVGKPFISGAKVTAKVENHGRGPKVKIIKFRRRKHHRKQMGHRQAYTELSITKIAAK
ncbi:MAG: 50S ribosomal protein L21 [Pseudomonadota bacterium]